MNFRDAMQIEESLERCCLKVTGKSGCSKPGCYCGNEPYVVVWLISPDEDAHGAVIQTVKKMDEFVRKLQNLRTELWGDER